MSVVHCPQGFRSYPGGNLSDTGGGHHDGVEVGRELPCSIHPAGSGPRLADEVSAKEHPAGHPVLLAPATGIEPDQSCLLLDPSICYPGAMASQSPDPTISSQTGDDDAKMRRGLGLDPPSQILPSSNPMKAARQAIRSQVTAREYTERQLAQAQGAIQDLRGRIRNFHQDRETAVAAVQSAMTARATAERNLASSETALAAERSTRGRTEQMLRDAEATVRDLREKLATANQSLQLVRAELAAELQARATADNASIAAMTPPVIAIPIAREEPVSPKVRRPVGRPRKMLTIQAEQPAIPPDKPAKFISTKDTNRTDDQEPVQWWVKGWKRR